MELLQRFKQYIQKENLFQPNDGLLLAVSGGIDSVVLCELCKQAGYNFVIAHCNFQLRGEESERDENFVRGLGEKYGVEVLVKKFDTKQIAGDEKKSIETTARDLRYQWFYEKMGSGRPTTDDRQRVVDDRLPTASFIVTGHHADDNIETVVMNFFRGTGIAGIRGMLPKQGKIVRPLLFARRAELENFVDNNQLQFVTDATNFENEYTRNFFRNQIIPLVKESYPEAEKNVLKNIHRFAETEQLYQQAIEQHIKKLLEKKGNEIHIPVLKLLQVKPLHSILYEIIKSVGFTSHQVEEVIALLQSETGKYIQSATHRIIKNRNWLIITPNQTSEAQNILIEKGDKHISYKDGNLQIEKHSVTNRQLQNTNLVAQLNAGEIKFPLLLRKWKQGDYFYPLGMAKKKKLSRFFIDQKLSLIQKENVWVIEMDKKIIWVVGMRIDNRFKITDSTKEIISLTLKGQ
jgi:tRNA(Ile)-lysidine synthase